MSDRMVDPAYLRYQYGDSEKLRIRIETHERYSERPSNYQEWVIGRLAPQPGQVVLDVGCGPGSFHRLLTQHDLHSRNCLKNATPSPDAGP